MYRQIYVLTLFSLAFFYTGIVELQELDRPLSCWFVCFNLDIYVFNSPFSCLSLRPWFWLSVWRVCGPRVTQDPRSDTWWRLCGSPVGSRGWRCGSLCSHGVRTANHTRSSHAASCSHSSSTSTHSLCCQRTRSFWVPLMTLFFTTPRFPPKMALEEIPPL